MLARFFVDRPVFATVLSVVIIVVGIVSLERLPIAQYPEVAPPTVSVTASYPGANAETVASTVAFPIEQEVNGVEGMLYMQSKSTSDGQMTLDVTFELGMDLDLAQVLVQNRVAIALPKLPQEAQRNGVTTKKKSSSILLCVNLISPTGKYDQLYLSNFATTNVKDDLARIKGVGDVVFLGPRDYSMRIWLDPSKLAARNLVSQDVVDAIRAQNVQVGAGRLGQAPVPEDVNVPFQLTINTLGRLEQPEQFGEIIVKTGTRGQLVQLKDLVSDQPIVESSVTAPGGIEFGAKNYDVNSYLDGKPAVTLAAYQLPGANALETADDIKSLMEERAKSFPEGIEYRLVYDTTVFISESVHEVYKTLIEAFILVFVVVLVFLQDWRATLLPMFDVPVSLIGTLAVMAALGFSINNLTLFGLVLAIGIVVDDAIVVVENIERWMAKGLPPREATIKAMEEITGPVIAITLVLSSVFVPTAFLAGINGEFYKQFALTIAAATIISAINAMTMAPARAVALIKPHSKDHAPEALPPAGIALLGGALVYNLAIGLVLGLFGLDDPEAGGALVWAVKLGLFAAGTVAGWFFKGPVNLVLGKFLRGFNKVFNALSSGYGGVVRGLLRISMIMLLVYGGLLFLTWRGFATLPKGFIPAQDKGYLVVNAQLPEGASLQRTDALLRKLGEEARTIPGVAHTIEVPGYSTLLSTNISNMGGMFVVLEPFEDRKGDESRSAFTVQAALQAKFAAHREAVTGVFNAPPVEGIGSTGGFKLQVQDRRGAGLAALQASTRELARAGMAEPGIANLFSTFSVNYPQVYLDIDREKAEAMGVSLSDVNDTLQTYLGSLYVNDFTFLNRNWQVNVQADPTFRMREEEIGRLEVRNSRGERVPLRTLVDIKDSAGPALVNHYNLYPSAELNGVPAPGTSSGGVIEIMDRAAEEALPQTMGFEWTELSLQEILASKDLLSKLVFPLAVLFVFMVLAAQYESWSLPLAILLIVPMCILAALLGVIVVNLDINIFTQIGLVVLIGLAAKNAILVVEFAKQLEDTGTERIDAIVGACRERLRPILMTSFAFILGVVPLITAKGAGAEMRYTLGVAVLSGMMGVTLFGIFFTPVFYYVIRWLTSRKSASTDAKSAPPPPRGLE
ncbi:MAG TPA: multidrug efflux RND transporter permease subunit, partial [Planctomycetota bacterium]|nr:multidrug efflux RND transporter permease subunit [Planctomycetota bacterium]